MCDNFLLTINANLHIDNPTKVEDSRCMHVCKLLVNIYSAYTVLKVKSGDLVTPCSLNYFTVAQLTAPYLSHLMM